MAKPFLRNNVGGIIFTKPTSNDYFSVEAWLTAKAPDNCNVYDDPLNLQLVGLSICDAQFIDGVYYRASFTKPAPAKITTRRFIEHKYQASSQLILEKYLGMIFYDANDKKHAGKKIGTTIQAW